MTRVKVCGITNWEDAAKAVEVGADALGFILVPDTPRYVGNLMVLTDILKRLPPLVARVAVCRSIADLSEALAHTFEAVQLYEFSREANLCDCLGLKVLRVVRIKDHASLLDIGEMPAEIAAVVLDAYHRDKLGGSGEVFNWDLAVKAKARTDRPVILAGGLTPENVGDAIRKVQPYAVDVGSGVEAVPGRKDRAKLRAFFKAVSQADREIFDETGS